MTNYHELSTRIQFEHDKLLKEDNASVMDAAFNESASLIQPIANITKPFVIQIQTEKTIESSVASTFRIRIPIAIIVISVLQIVFHMYDSMNRINGTYSKSARILLFTSTDKIEVWRLITYMFVHKDYWHLGVNVIFQLAGGILLEISDGWWRVIIIYLAGGLAGSLGVESISRFNALVGASAGVYAILGALALTLILNWKETENRGFRFCVILVFVLFTYYFTPQMAYRPEFESFACMLDSQLTNTNITHFFGFMMGILTAMTILINTDVQLWKISMQAISVIVLVLITSLAIYLIIIFPDFNIKSLIGCETNY